MCDAKNEINEINEISISLLESCLKLGEDYFNKECCDMAEDSYNKALKILEKLYCSEEDRESYYYKTCLAKIYFMLGNTYMKSETYCMAENMYIAAIEESKPLAEENMQKYGWNLVVAYENLSCAYSFQGRKDEADQMYKKELEIRQQLD